MQLPSDTARRVPDIRVQVPSAVKVTTPEDGAVAEIATVSPMSMLPKFEGLKTGVFDSSPEPIVTIDDAADRGPSPSELVARTCTR